MRYDVGQTDMGRSETWEKSIIENLQDIVEANIHMLRSTLWSVLFKTMQTAQYSIKNIITKWKKKKLFLPGDVVWFEYFLRTVAGCRFGLPDQT